MMDFLWRTSPILASKFKIRAGNCSQNTCCACSTGSSWTDSTNPWALGTRVKNEREQHSAALWETSVCFETKDNPRVFGGLHWGFSAGSANGGAQNSLGAAQGAAALAPNPLTSFSWEFIQALVSRPAKQQEVKPCPSIIIIIIPLDPSAGAGAASCANPDQLLNGGEKTCHWFCSFSSARLIKLRISLRWKKKHWAVFRLFTVRFDACN